MEVDKKEGTLAEQGVELDFLQVCRTKVKLAGGSSAHGSVSVCVHARGDS